MDVARIDGPKHNYQYRNYLETPARGFAEMVYLGGGVSRNVSPQIDGAKQRAPDWEDPKFWHTNISKKSSVGLKVALSLKGKKRLAKSLPTKWGFQS